MREQMVITDLTRMQGDRICIGGYLQNGTPIRPVCKPTGPTEAWLQPSSGSVPVTPFSVVELEVGAAPMGLEPPHTEDRVVPSTGHEVVDIITEGGRLSWLGWSESPSVREIFGAEVLIPPDQQWGRYVQSGVGLRSLGTIKAARISDVAFFVSPDTGKRDYRLRFRDLTGKEFRLAVVALDFRNLLDELLTDGLSASAAARRVLVTLQRQDVFLRIGLARRWDRFPDRCYLQITGVYGFSVGDRVIGSTEPSC